MSDLSILLELQSVHDNLAIIQRDLSNLPPDMDALDKEAKTLAKRLEGIEKNLADLSNQQVSLTKELQIAQKLEDAARAALKSATQKVQYTSAIRELDERERQKASVAKPLKEAEARITALEQEKSDLMARQTIVDSEFKGLEQIFLAEHENQVAARTRLLSRRTELETTMEANDLSRFNRLLQFRQGRAVVAVENGACAGCRTKLRGPFLSMLREKTTLNCESCQRILYVPAKV